MTVGEIAGLIAAVAFVLLVGLCAVPLIKLGKVFDELTVVVRDVGTSSVPILDELKGTVQVTNEEIGRIGAVTTDVGRVTADVAKVSEHAGTVVENAATLSNILTTAIGRPLVTIAASVHAFRAAILAKTGRARQGEPTASGEAGEPRS